MSLVPRRRTRTQSLPGSTWTRAATRLQAPRDRGDAPTIQRLTAWINYHPGQRFDFAYHRG